ncbi:MAG: hypothetical protein KAG97_09875, partial [Victivallales bacterium]|nr:hypothetical protein [Victivallales bacterium]
GDDMIALYRKVGSASNADTVHKMLEQLSPVGDMLYRALNKQVFLETILLKAMRMAHAVEIKHLIAGLNQIRKSGNLSILENLPSVSETEKPSAQPIATPANAGQRPFVQSSASSGGRSETHEVQPPSQTVAPVASTPTVSSVDSSRSAPRQQMASPLSQKPNAVAEQQSKYAVNQPVNVSEQRQAPVVEPSQNVVSTTPETFPQTPASIAPQPPTPSVGGHDSDSESAKVTVVTAPVAHTPPSDTATSQQSVASSSNSTSTVNASSASLSKNTPLVEPFSETAKTEVANKPLLLTNPVSTTDSSEMPMTSAAASPASPAKPESANAVWHALTTEMERCSQPLLKAYMMEGMPKTFVDGKLSVAFDDEFETVHVAALLKEIALLETCLKRVVGNKAASLEIIKYAGIASPRDIPIIDDNVKEEIKQRAKQNPFVQSVLNLFEGEIVDVRG